MKASIPLFSPRRLINLADMIRSSVSLYLDAEGVIKVHYNDFICKPDRNAPVAVEEKHSLLEKLQTVARPKCSDLRLEQSTKLIRQLEDALRGKWLEPSYEKISTRLLSLWHIMWDEVREKEFAFIPPDNAQFFEKEDLFGKAVARAFGSAIPEIKDAGNCLAADLNTAAVFHLMRIAEIGLRALAGHLDAKVPNKPLELATWEEIIKKIETKIKEKFDPKPAPPKKRKVSTKKKTQDKEFYRGVMGEFYAFRDVWRNSVMHTRGRYNAAEALGVFARVGEFMKRLSSRVSEVK